MHKGYLTNQSYVQASCQKVKANLGMGIIIIAIKEMSPEKTNSTNQGMLMNNIENLLTYVNTCTIIITSPNMPSIVSLKISKFK